jgi:hypothetical protein
MNCVQVLILKNGILRTLGTSLKQIWVMLRDFIKLLHHSQRVKAQSLSIKQTKGEILL